MEGATEKREQPLRVSFIFSFKWCGVCVGRGGLVLRGSSRKASVLRIGSRIETVLQEVVFFKGKGLRA